MSLTRGTGLLSTFRSACDILITDARPALQASMGWRWAALCVALCCGITAAAADYNAANYQKNMSSYTRTNLRNVRTSLHGHGPAPPAPMPNPNPLSEGAPVSVPRLVPDSLRWHNISRPASAKCKVGPWARGMRALLQASQCVYYILRSTLEMLFCCLGTHAAALRATQVRSERETFVMPREHGG